MSKTKEAYYFSHDYNARRDPKIIAMRKTYGYEGYGWYWAIIEMMREETTLQIPLNPVQKIAMAEELKTDETTVTRYISDCVAFGLFAVLDIDENGDKRQFLISHSFKERMCKYLESKELRKIAGKKGAEKRWHSDSNAIASSSGAIASDSKVKERKVKESKYIERFKPPTFEQVYAYCKERGNNVDAQKFIDHYEANGWFRGKTKIKDWKACVRTWEKKEISTNDELLKRHGKL